MKLRDVLAQKPIAGVVSISDRETVSALTQMLKEKGVGAAVVASGDRELVGVVSERDVIRAIAQAGADCLNEPVARHMTIDVKTASPDETVNDVLDRMTQGRFRHMPVLERGALVGVVSIGDLVKAQIGALKAEKAALEEYVRS